MRPTLLAVIAAVSAATALSAQKQAGGRLTQDRVLAEAVSSYSDTGEFFLVGATVRPFTVIGYFRTRGAADSAATRAGSQYRAYGPYQGQRTRDPWEVLSITVRVRTDSGERELHYDPRTVDAVFLSMSAVRKFLVPYYRRVYGPGVAASVEPMILAPTPPTPPCHTMSVPCTADSLLPFPMSPVRRH
jgi:hypothetical protein